MASWGVLDFAGGIVVHNIAGIAALASVLYVGRRKVDRQRAAYHSARRARHRAALVRLVRIQRGQRAARGLGDRGRVPQHRPRGELRGGSPGSPSSGCTTRKPKFLGLAHRRGGRARDDHAGRRLRVAHVGVRHRRALRHRLLLRRGAQEPAALGRRARRVGRARRRRVPRHPLAAARSRRPRSIPRAPTDCSTATRISSSCSSAPCASRSVWAFVFTYGMLWVIDRITPVKVGEEGETAGLDQSLHGEVAYIEAL